MSFSRALWSWTTPALLGLFGAVVLLGVPLGSLLGSGSGAPARWAIALTVAWALLTVTGAAASRLSPKGRETKLLETFARGVNALLLIGVLGILGRATLALAPTGRDTAFAKFLDRAFAPAWSTLATGGDRIGLPADLAGVPTPPLALFTLLFLGRNAISWHIDKVRRRDYRGNVPLPIEARPPRQTSDEARERAKAIERRIAVASYAEAKTLLDASRTELTFVSLDIVGSTLLKQGEDPHVVEQSFAAYRGLVESALRRHGAWKQVWTPDGQMAAFRSPDAGVDCAKEVLRGLPELNRTSGLERPFRVRAGANVGTVCTDGRTPMEQISDLAVDVAGHLQKFAEANTLWISEELHERLDDPSDFAATSHEVHGRRVFAWKTEA